MGPRLREMWQSSPGFFKTKVSLAIVVFMMALFPAALHAQVITDPAVNSWDEPGFLMVVIGLGSVVTIILLTILYESHRKKKRESS